MTRIDINKDGCVSLEDFVLMGKQLAEYGGLTKEEADLTDKQMKSFADALNLQPGVRIPTDEAARKLRQAIKCSKQYQLKYVKFITCFLILLTRIKMKKSLSMSLKSTFILLPQLLLKMKLSKKHR